MKEQILIVAHNLYKSRSTAIIHPRFTLTGTK